MKHKIRYAFENIYLFLIFLFFYLPIAVLMVFSFNNSKSRGSWGGFSLRWYVEMFEDAQLMGALRTTLIVGIVSALLATIIGTAAAIGIRAFRKKSVRNIISNVTNIPMISSELVTGVSL